MSWICFLFSFTRFHRSVQLCHVAFSFRLCVTPSSFSALVCTFSAASCTCFSLSVRASEKGQTAFSVLPLCLTPRLTTAQAGASSGPSGHLTPSLRPKGRTALACWILGSLSVVRGWDGGELPLAPADCNNREITNSAQSMNKVINA